MNEWNNELDSNVRQFVIQANEVAIWDRALMENSEKVRFGLIVVCLFWSVRLLAVLSPSIRSTSFCRACVPAVRYAYCATSPSYDLRDRTIYLI